MTYLKEDTILKKLSRIFLERENPPRIKTILNWATASVWFFMGFYSKLLDGMPRHRMIVARILGEDIAWQVIYVIGVIEIIIALWVFSKIRPLACASVQTAALIFMNTFELIYTPDLLLLGYAHAGLSVFLIGIVWYQAMPSKP